MHSLTKLGIACATVLVYLLSNSFEKPPPSAWGFCHPWGVTVSTAVSVAVRRFLAVTATVCSFALVGSGLAPVAAQPLDQAPAAADATQTGTRPDAMSAQVTARATGHRVEDTSQRTETSQVFSNPDGTWTSESFTLPKFRAGKDGTMEPIPETGVFSDAGRAFTATGARLEVSAGEGLGSKAAVPLVEMTGTGEAADHTLVLGWEGPLPAPELADGQAVYETGIEVPVVSPDEPGGSGPAPAAPTAEPAGTADARVVVEPTRTGFQHNVVLDQAPEGDVVLRFPLTFSEGLVASLDPEDSEIRVVNADGELVFHAPTPLMWDAEIDAASGLPAAETPVDTQLVDEDGVQVLILTAHADWLQAAERVYPVTIDPAWSGNAGADTWVQSGSTIGHGGSTELRVGTFDGGTTRARTYMKFSPQTLTGKKIVKAELRLNNYYSYSCASSEIRLQRVLEDWNSTSLVWTGQPAATITGQGTSSASKGYSSSVCPGGSVFFPATAIVQHWADNPTQVFGMRLVATDETNSNTWNAYVKFLRQFGCFWVTRRGVPGRGLDGQLELPLVTGGRLLR